MNWNLNLLVIYLRIIKNFDDFASMITVVDLRASDIILKNKVLEMRNVYRLKLPDAIVAATAIINKAILVTADHDFKKVKEIQLMLIKQ